MFKRDKLNKVARKKKNDDGEESSGDEWLDDDGVPGSDSEGEKHSDGSKVVRDDVMRAKYPAEDIKMVLVVREDLKMGKGKIGA